MKPYGTSLDNAYYNVSGYGIIKPPISVVAPTLCSRIMTWGFLENAHFRVMIYYPAYLDHGHAYPQNPLTRCPLYYGS